MAKEIDEKIIVRIVLHEDDELLQHWFSLFNGREQELNQWVSAALFSALSNERLDTGVVSKEKIVRENLIGIGYREIDVPVYNKELICGFAHAGAQIVSEIVKDKIYEGLCLGDCDEIPNVRVPKEIVLRETIKHKSITKGTALREKCCV